LRTSRTAALAPLGQFTVQDHMEHLQTLYFGGDMEAAIPLCGQVCGRIDAIKSAREIVAETMASFRDIMRGLAGQYVV
jgi:enoyl-[acyl-carrier protein] reductase II